MLGLLKRFVNKSPLEGIWRRVKKERHKRYLAKNSSAQPIFPLYCISCNRYYREFRPLSSYYDEMFVKYGFPYRTHDAETLNSDQYMCPACGINDRDRLYALYLQKNIDQQRRYDLVEFAPSPQLSGYIKKFKNIKHRTADLFMKDVDDKADLMDLCIYTDNSFDIFICSHILEHVDDDVQAMHELYRILKPGGFGIAMVPILKGVEKTTEDPSIKDEQIRWKYFGQNDHVRLYEREDYIQRLESVGFKVNQFGKQYFGEKVLSENGIAGRSVLYIVEK